MTPDSPSMSKYLSAQDAANALGVKTATLYAYVSRGLIRSEQVGGSIRNRRYHAEDVQRQKQKQEQRRNPASAATHALHWGSPVLESALTLIADGRLLYRGQDAIALSRSHTFEQVAALLWDTDANKLDFAEDKNTALSVLLRDLPLPLIAKFQTALTWAAVGNPTAYDIRPANVIRIGGHIIGLMVQATDATLNAKVTLAQTLATAWASNDVSIEVASTLINTALILCADHELNTSAFTARCVASTGASAYGAVLAGLAALQGPKHGGHTAQVQALLNEVTTPAHATHAINARLQRGETLPGFGHLLYPDGDPRGAALLAQLAQTLPNNNPVLKRVQAIVSTVATFTGDRPTIDFALVALADTLGLPQDAALALFAIGRTAGWVGHVLEQYASGEMIRPRAKYVGV